MARQKNSGGKLTEINKIYWISHPGFYFLYGKDTYTLNQIERYFRIRLEQIVDLAKIEPDSLVVFVKTPESKLPENSNPAKKDKELRELEKKFKIQMKRKLGIRSIIPKTEQKEVAQVLSEIHRNGFTLAKDAAVYGFGSDWRLCSKGYPRQFRKLAGIKGEFHVPIWGLLMPKGVRGIIDKRGADITRRLTREERIKQIKGRRKNPKTPEFHDIPKFNARKAMHRK